MTQVNTERLVNHFCELVKIDSESGNEKGLTTVNLSTGMSKVHTTEEFIAVDDMVKITDFVISYVTA